MEDLIYFLGFKVERSERGKHLDREKKIIL